MLEQHKVIYVKKYKMTKAVPSRFVNKYKSKRTVETEHLGG